MLFVCERNKTRLMTLFRVHVTLFLTLHSLLCQNGGEGKDRDR